jgi:hypothetical protein
MEIKTKLFGLLECKGSVVYPVVAHTALAGCGEHFET